MTPAPRARPVAQAAAQVAARASAGWFSMAWSGRESGRCCPRLPRLSSRSSEKAVSSGVGDEETALPGKLLPREKTPSSFLAGILIPGEAQDQEVAGLIRGYVAAAGEADLAVAIPYFQRALAVLDNRPEAAVLGSHLARLQRLAVRRKQPDVADPPGLSELHPVRDRVADVADPDYLRYLICCLSESLAQRVGLGVTERRFRCICRHVVPPGSRAGEVLRHSSGLADSLPAARSRRSSRYPRPVHQDGARRAA